jgi:hypothetical protein
MILERIFRARCGDVGSLPTVLARCRVELRQSYENFAGGVICPFAEAAKQLSKTVISGPPDNGLFGWVIIVFLVKLWVVGDM